MKTLKERLGFDSSLPKGDGEAPANATLVREFSEELYSRLAEESEPSVSPLVLGDVRVVGGLFMSDREFQLSDPKSWIDFFGEEGEILVRGHLELWQIKVLLKLEGQIVYYSDRLIYMKAPDIEARFTRVTVDRDDYVAEFIAKTESDKAMNFLVNASELFCAPIYSRIVRFAKLYVNLPAQEIIGCISSLDVALFAAAVGARIERCEDYTCHGKGHVRYGKAYLCVGTLRELGADKNTPETEVQDIAKRYIIEKFGKNGELPC